MRCLRDANHHLISTKPLPGGFDRPQLGRRRHHERNECTTCEAITGAESEGMGVRGASELDREPESEEEG